MIHFFYDESDLGQVKKEINFGLIYLKDDVISLPSTTSVLAGCHLIHHTECFRKSEFIAGS